MQSVDPHMQIARKIKSIESSKTELVQQVAEVFRGIQTTHERHLVKSLAGVIGLSYLLAQQMGIPLDTIDAELRQGLPKSLLADSLDMQDLEVIQRYFSGKR